MENGGYVYILSNHQKRLYTGVTAQLRIRVRQHQQKKNLSSFTARYNITQLVYYEPFETITEAIARESTIKNMHRLVKIQLIVGLNPDWKDLSSSWDQPIAPFEEAKLKPPTTF